MKLSIADIIQFILIGIGYLGGLFVWAHQTFYINRPMIKIEKIDRGQMDNFEQHIQNTKKGDEIEFHEEVWTIINLKFTVSNTGAIPISFKKQDIMAEYEGNSYEISDISDKTHKFPINLDEHDAISYGFEARTINIPKNADKLKFSLIFYDVKDKKYVGTSIINKRR